jgi:uncharacterized protein (DUF302 family)
VAEASRDLPVGVAEAPGVLHRRSTVSVGDTVDRLSDAITAARAKVFAVIDQSAEAADAGMELRETKLLIFGSPAAGTPLMVAAPIVALDLPLRILVWADDRGEVWMSCLTGEWLAERHQVPLEMAGPLGAANALTRRVAETA